MDLSSGTQCQGPSINSPQVEFNDMDASSGAEMYNDNPASRPHDEGVALNDAAQIAMSVGNEPRETTGPQTSTLSARSLQVRVDRYKDYQAALSTIHTALLTLELFIRNPPHVPPTAVAKAFKPVIIKITHLLTVYQEWETKYGSELGFSPITNDDDNDNDNNNNSNDTNSDNPQHTHFSSDNDNSRDLSPTLTALNNSYHHLADKFFPQLRRLHESLAKLLTTGEAVVRDEFARMKFEDVVENWKAECLIAWQVLGGPVDVFQD